ncbi:MAG: homoserine kinase [Bacteroidia bacterium]
MKKVIVYTPASVANVVCGFDILGFALDGPFDKMVIHKTDKRGVTIINLDEYGLPVDPTENVIGAALLAMLKEVKEEIGFVVESTKSIKPGSGIGSSAASAAGAVVGANHLLHNLFTKKELVNFAMYGEEIASGARHADNIAPCIYGGVTLIRSLENLDIISIPVPELHVTVLHPQIEVKTSEARKVLGKEVSLKDATKQWANVAGLMTGFLQRDYNLISRSMEDVIAEPLRSHFIPGFHEVKEKCLAAGALGGGISGSGPSVFMLSKNKVTAMDVEGAMREVYGKMNINFNTYVTSINKEGVRLSECKN